MPDIVLQRNILVGECMDGIAKGTGKTEICQLELALLTIDEQVLGLEISVHDHVRVAEFNAAQQLRHG